MLLIQHVILGLLVIVAHQQNTVGLWFKVPLVPLIPALSIFFNIELMVHLQALTWVRFVVWMALGKCIHGTLMKITTCHGSIYYGLLANVIVLV
jgi:hypothetical protein